MFARVVINVLRDPHILQAVFFYLFLVTVFPPHECLKPVPDFFPAECCLGDGVQLDAAAERIFYLLQNIQTFYLREVARVILVEKGNVKVVGVEADNHIRAFKIWP